MNSRVITPRHISFLTPTPTTAVMGNRAFLRMWAARRAAKRADAARLVSGTTPTAPQSSSLIPLSLSH